MLSNASNQRVTNRLTPQPREWQERLVDVVYLKDHEAGGHFPALNVPGEWLQDVRDFFGGLARGEF
jgi:hypothetical protein